MSDEAIVQAEEPTVEAPANASAPAEAPLRTELEAVAQRSIEEAYRVVEALEADKNRAAESIAAFSTGLLHSDTITVDAPKVANEGPRQEQVHKNL